MSVYDKLITTRNKIDAALDYCNQALAKRGIDRADTIYEIGDRLEPLEIDNSLRNSLIDGSITEVYDDTITNLDSCIFNDCSSLTILTLTACSKIGDYEFMGCVSLTSVNLPAVISIGSNMFTSCSTLTSISLPKCTDIGYKAFYDCRSLTSIDLPVCNAINTNAFYNCFSLSFINLPACRMVPMSTFVNCKSLESVYLPDCRAIDNNAFYNCVKLSSLSLPECYQIAPSVFFGCLKLMSLTLGYSGVVSLLDVEAFQNTPMSKSQYTGSFGSIYVPASLVEAYKVASNWSAYADRITAIIG